MRMIPSDAAWWRRESLRFEGGRLTLAGRDVAALAGAFAEPCFLYDGDRVVENLARVGKVLAARGLRHRVYYAMKANRFRPLLCHLRSAGVFGLDVCSGEELREGLACGFVPARLSYTAHGLTDEDARLLASFPDVVANLDAVSSIHRLGRAMPGRPIGLRVNPGVGTGYGGSEKLSYAGGRTTKFGIYHEHLREALDAARCYGMPVVALHCHAGCGYLTRQLDAFAQVLAAIMEFLPHLPDLSLINLGGGLGVPHKPEDAPLDLDRWSGLIADSVGRSGIEIAIEPGDYAVKDAGLLVVRVTYVERKRETVFVGVNGGFNLAMEPTFYDLPCVPVPCVPRPGAAHRVTIAGNINEALDLWASGVALPPMEDGDLLALLNTGGYGSSMSSNHCMNGRFREMLLAGDNR